MFRPMNRRRQLLTEEECIEVLKSELRGVLSVNGDDGYPYGLPTNHYYCEEDGKLYFHSGKTGHKVDAIKRDSKASFCVLDAGYQKDGEWALHFKSVIVFGRIELLEDRETTYRIARQLSRRFTDDEAYIDREIEHAGPATLVFALVPEFISGKQVEES